MLLGPVREAMIALDLATPRELRFDPATAIRTFTIATSDYAALILLRPLLGQLAREAPAVRLRLVPITAGIADALARGGLDFACLPLEVDGQLSRFPRKALFEDRFVLAADRDNPSLADCRGPTTRLSRRLRPGR